MADNYGWWNVDLLVHVVPVGVSAAGAVTLRVSIRRSGVTSLAMIQSAQDAKLIRW